MNKFWFWYRFLIGRFFGGYHPQRAQQTPLYIMSSICHKNVEDLKGHLWAVAE